MDIIVYLLLEGVIEAISYTSKPKETSRIVTISIFTLIITTMMVFLILSYLARADQEKMIVLLLLSGLTAFTAYDFQKEKKKQNAFWYQLSTTKSRPKETENVHLNLVLTVSFNLTFLSNEEM